MKNFQKNYAGNLALLFFILLSAVLVSSATIVLSQLFHSISGLYEIANPPEFLQMHKGEIDKEKIDSFCASYEGIENWQSVGMINVYGDDIYVYGNEEFSLEDCKLDISLVKQNEERDLLLDKERNIIDLERGEIAIPVILLDKYPIKKGDAVILSSNGLQKEFVVSDFVYDAQMNSTMCSSTRILISDGDYQELFGKIGEKEYLIEVYFADKNMVNAFQAAYENANLPQAGQAVTIKMIFLLSAMTDIMLAMIFVFVSVLLIFIAFMCMKYTILAAMEEDIKEIGAMKAIGMSHREIESLYLKKYKQLIMIGILSGYIVALAASPILLTHIYNMFGKEPISIVAIIVPIAACTLLYFVNCAHCKNIFKKVKGLSVIDTLVTQKGFEKREGKNFKLIFIVMFLISALVILPFNILSTIQEEEFITYMGSSMDDIMIEMDSTVDLSNKQHNMENILKNDDDVKNYKEARRVRLETKNGEGEKRNLHIDCGENSGVQLQYLEGKAPQAENEIALSKLNAEELSKRAGDGIVVLLKGEEKKFLVSGIYQDVTSGGYTAKAEYEFNELEAEKITFTVKLKDNIEINHKADSWKQELGKGIEIEPMESFLDGILGGVSSQVEKAAILAAMIGVTLTVLITLLFLKLQFARDCSQIAILKAIGYCDIDVRKKYLFKVGSVAFAGIIAGMMVTNLFGDILVSAGFGILGLGISKIVFAVKPLQAFVILPCILYIITASTIWISSRQIKKYHITSFIQE